MHHQSAPDSAQEETALMLLSPMLDKNQQRPTIERTPQTLPTVRKNSKMSEKAKERLGVNEFTDKKGRIYKAIFAEYLGTTVLNFFGCASCIALAVEPADVVKIALAFGMAIMVGVQSFAHVSGGHLNPAITFGFLITGRVSILRGLLYIVFQCAGCLTGSALLKAFVPTKGGMGLTAIHTNLSPVQGMGVEFFNGFVLVLVVFAVCDPNRPFLFIVAPLAIGLTIVLGHVATVPLTGAAMNPARSFGAAAVVNNWTNHWIYWAGPILGGALAAILYQLVFAAPPESEYSEVRTEDKPK